MLYKHEVPKLKSKEFIHEMTMNYIKRILYLNNENIKNNGNLRKRKE